MCVTALLTAMTSNPPLSHFEITTTSRIQE